jgi:hypothetical protein
VSRSKDIGTRAETAVARYLQTHGWPAVERRQLTGRYDKGDITGTPGVCWEVKVSGRPVYDKQLDGWMTETEVERRNASADVGVLVVRRKGVAEHNAGHWWAYLPVSAVVMLGSYQSADRVPVPRADVAPIPVRMLLDDAALLLRHGGYGTPIVPGDRGAVSAP